MIGGFRVFFGVDRRSVKYDIKRCYYGHINPTENAMRTTLALDDDLLAKAQALTGLAEKTVLVREALRALIERLLDANACPTLGYTVTELVAMLEEQAQARAAIPAESARD